MKLTGENHHFSTHFRTNFKLFSSVNHQRCFENLLSHLDSLLTRKFMHIYLVFVRSLLSAWSLHRNRRYWQLMLRSDWSPGVWAALLLVSQPSLGVRPLEALLTWPAIKLSVTTKLKWRLGETRRTNILLDRLGYHRFIRFIKHQGKWWRIKM